MNNIEKYECDDDYEAQKAVGLLNTLQRGENTTTYIVAVAALIRNEILITLSDKSTHSISLRDDKDANRLRSLIENVLNGKDRILYSRVQDRMLEVAVNR
jgi:hypothetical protein